MADESDKRMDRLIEALQGITYLEWKKVQISIDRNYENEKRRLENMLQLTDLDLEQIRRTKRSIFL